MEVRGGLNARPVGASNTVSSLNFNPSQDISNATTIKMTGGGSGTDFQIPPTVNGSPGTKLAGPACSELRREPFRGEPQRWPG